MSAADGTLVADAPGAEREFNVPYVTRVEGEGSLVLRVRDREVVEARLKIFEAPRYFERIVVGRTGDEVIDIVARICGICPIAYQMTAVHAFEDLYGVQVDPAIRSLRRLLYCGEYIQSHALHVYLLHAPDYLGYPSALAMAADHRAVVEQGLAIKKIGNQLISALGGRPVHPISVRVGGFSRVPWRRDLDAVRRALDDAVAWSQATVSLVASWDPPAFEHPQPLVALRHPDEYPFNDGRIVSSDGLDIAPGAWGDAFEELHLEGTNALHARTRHGEVYLLGPTAQGLPCRRPAPPAGGGGAGGDRPPGRHPHQHPPLDRGSCRRAAPCVRGSARHHRCLPVAARAACPVHPSGGDRRLVHGGSTGPPPSPVRGGRAGPRGPRPDRAPNQPEPGSHRGRPRGIRPERPRAPPSRGRPPPRDADPGVRPVHQLRDSLPRSPDRGGRSVGGERMTHLAPPSVRLLVCGNADRGDDGAALSAVATLLPSLPSALLERLEVRRCGHLRVEDLTDVRPGEIAVVVDAAVGIPPGHVVIAADPPDPGGGRFARPALLARAAHRPGAGARPGAPAGRAA